MNKFFFFLRRLVNLFSMNRANQTPKAEFSLQYLEP